MSTYYFLQCEDHKEYCNGACDNGDNILIKSNEILPSFIAKHAYCDVKIKDENVVEYDYKEFTKKDEWFKT